ncbi:MAG TPA: methyltransferase domain-containing protein [Polyangiaceae bacterium]
MARAHGESGGDVDYDAHGAGYALKRRTDPRIEALVHAALGNAKTIVNVGAGAGSYEPLDRHVIAIEPSRVMRAQRSPLHSPAIDGVAERLPLDDASVDAAMAMITVHQWADAARGLKELRRVTRGPVVVLTFDPDALDRFWLADYVPELVAAERTRFPYIDSIRGSLGGTSRVTVVPVPIDCVDGFTEAYYARPERFLEPAVRRSQSAWGFVGPDVADRRIGELTADLASGKWDQRYGEWRRRPTFEGSLRLVVADPG